MQISARYLTVVDEDIDYKKVGGNNTPLATFTLAENINRKVDGEWEQVGTNFWDAEIWGDLAKNAAIELSKGQRISLQAEYDGDRVDHKAVITQKEWEYEGESYSKVILKIFDYELVD